MADQNLEAGTFTALNHKIRSVALVGYFLQYWSVLEARMNSAIGKALRLNPIQTVVVTKNVQVRDKINILKTLVDLRGREVKRFKDALEEISTMSLDRNMVAHDMFMADEKGDGVSFQVVKAKGKLTFPDTHTGRSQLSSASSPRSCASQRRSKR